MTPFEIGLGSVVVIVALIYLGIYIPVALALTSFVGVWLIRGNVDVAINMLALASMQAIAHYIFGVIPLAIAVGPGAEMRQAMGTAVAFGMIGVTFFGLIFTPVFYVVCRALDRFMPKAMQHSTLHAHGHPEPAE